MTGTSSDRECSAAWPRRLGCSLATCSEGGGAPAAVQRFGSAINLNVHFHTLIPDGVFDLSRPGRALFVRLPAPSDEELERILTRIIRKVARYIAQLLARIATLVPRPRTHAIRYHGVFAPTSRDRARVVPDGSGGEPGQPRPEHHQAPARSPAALQPVVAYTSPAGLSPFQPSPQPAPVTGDSDRLGPRYRVPWAELLRKVFSLDVLSCPQCGGRMELIAFFAEAGVAKRILDHLGLPSTGPPVATSRAPEETFDSAPEYDGADSTWDE